MNVGNLQLEGLLMAVAAVNGELVRKGLLSADAIDLALRKAEASVCGEERNQEDLTPSNRDAVAFPIRFLALANRGSDGDPMPAFSDLAKRVGQTKRASNDQM